MELPYRWVTNFVVKWSSQIIRERRWKEVTAVFSFPSTATNASFVLRKYYVSLLHHYEQIYFFKAQGWAPISAGVCIEHSTFICINVVRLLIISGKLLCRCFTESIYNTSSISWIGWTSFAITWKSTGWHPTAEDKFCRYISWRSLLFCVLICFPPNISHKNHHSCNFSHEGDACSGRCFFETAMEPF